MLKILKATALIITAAATLPTALAASARTGEATTFTVMIRNASSGTTLKLPDGKTAPAPIAPGLYAVVRGGAKLFQPGEAANRALESLAEDGDASALLAMIRNMNGVVSADMFAPGLPLAIKAEPGDRLVFATMFVQSNDKFLAPDPEGIELFDGDKPKSGDLTAAITLWDAGTEKDEAPGVGRNQAPRQSGPNTGPDEAGIVRPADDGFTYPDVADVIQLTVLPTTAMSKSGS